MRRRHSTKQVINGQEVRAADGYPVIVNIIEGIQSRLAYMRERHAQVLYVACVATYPAGELPVDPSGNISRTMRKFHQKADRENVEMMTVWIMEVGPSGNLHFNIIILADGTKVQRGFTPWNWLNDIWAREINVQPCCHYVHCCFNDVRYFPPAAAMGIRSGYELRLRRNSPEEQIMADNIINAASYYAKVHTKENLPSGCRCFGSSQIPENGAIYEHSGIVF